MDELVVPLKPRKTPFMRVELDPMLWQKLGGKEEWWSLDTGSKFFEEGMPYYGITQCEVISRNREGNSVVNLALENGDDEGLVFSFGFNPSNGFEVFLNSTKNKRDLARALKITLELLSHFPEEPVRKELCKRINLELVKEDSLFKKAWERI